MSRQWEVLAAVETLAKTVSGLTGTGAVDVRERPFWSSEHGDPLPFLCVSGQAEKVAALQFENNAWWDYPALLVLYQKRSGLVANRTDMQTQYTVRQALADLLFRAGLSGVPGVIAADYEPRPPFGPAGLDKLVLVSAQLFTFRYDSNRSG